MLNLTVRQFQIAKKLLMAEAYISARFLSETYHVSVRAIHYDLDTIEYYFRKQGVRLIKSRINGVRIEGSEENRKLLLDQINNNVPQINFPYLIAIEFLLKSTTTVMNLAHELEVSRNKIIQSLPEVEKILQAAGLFIEKRPSIGMTIRGDENQIRMAKFKLSPLISDDLESYFSKKLISYQKEKMIKVITAYQHVTGIGFSDQGIKELVLTLCYQQLRISQGYTMAYSSDETKEVINSEDFEIIKSCFENEGMILAVEEMIFVLYQIRNTQVVYLSNTNKNHTVHHDVIKLSREFAMLISERLGVDFVGNGSFLKGLKLHLNVALHRLRSGQVIKNPLTESIRYKYRFIFETCKQMMMQLEQDYDLNFPDDEIAYVAMHVGACFEMISQAGYMPKALVICNSGLATSNLLTTRLKMMLPELSILGPLSLSELTPALIDEVDFIISTISFPLVEKDLVVVHPLLEIEDVLTLKKRVINATSKKQLSYLMLDVKADRLRFGDLLSAEQIELQKSLTNWRIAIEVAARPLVANGSIQESYVKAMICAVEQFGPYMVFIPNIAVVHAAPSSGVVKEGISVLTLDAPLRLGDGGGVSVSCFIVLATAQKESQLFMNLIHLLDRKNNVEKLLSSYSKQEILEITNE